MPELHIGNAIVTYQESLDTPPPKGRTRWQRAFRLLGRMERICRRYKPGVTRGNSLGIGGAVSDCMELLESEGFEYHDYDDRYAEWIDGATGKVLKRIEDD